MFLLGEITVNFGHHIGSKDKIKRRQTIENVAIAKNFKNREVKTGKMRKGLFEK